MPVERDPPRCLRRTAHSGAIALLLGIATTTGAAEATYPSRPIRFVVPFPPGGGNDITARTIGAKLTEAWGQQVVIDNRPGAGGVIGAEIAARAAPDGYTLFLGGVGSHAINPAMHKQLPYDPIKDFAPVSLIAIAPLLLVVHPSIPANSVKELIALARAKPGFINFASNGQGGSSHLAGELFKMLGNVDMTHVPYKGFGPSLTGLLSGQVQIMFSSIVPMLPQVKAGKLRALAQTGPKRSSAVPEIPTVAEAGLAGYQTASWYGVLVPARTPGPIVDKLSIEVKRIAELPDVRSRMSGEGADPVGSTPAEFAEHIRGELARWRKVVERAGLRAG